MSNSLSPLGPEGISGKVSGPSFFVLIPRFKRVLSNVSRPTVPTCYFASNRSGSLCLRSKLKREWYNNEKFASIVPSVMTTERSPARPHRPAEWPSSFSFRADFYTVVCVATCPLRVVRFDSLSDLLSAVSNGKSPCVSYTFMGRVFFES